MPHSDGSTPKKPARVKIGRLIAYPRRPPGKRDGRWYWQVVIHEGTGQRSLKGASRRGTPDEMTAHLAALLVERGLEALDPDEERSGLSANMDHLLRAWLTEQQARADRQGAGITQSSYQAFKNRVRTWAKRLGSWPTAKLLERGVLQAEVDALAREYAARTVRSLVDALRMAWRAGLDAGRCEGVLPRLELPRVDEDSRVNRHATPTREQARALLTQLEADTANIPKLQWRHLAGELLAATGGRPAEIGALTWSDIDWQRREVVLRGKTGRRVIGLPGRALTVLRARWTEQGQPETGSVLGVPFSRLNGASFHDALLAAGKRAGLPLEITPYSLRRLVSWTLIEAAVDPVRYQEIMGHTYQQGLRDYARSTPAARQAAWRLLDLGEE